MAGHSKWANIKHRKGAQDLVKSKAITKMLRLIKGVIKVGGNDPKLNTALSAALEKARQANVPKDKLERTVNPPKNDNLQKSVYEYNGFGGVGFLLEVETDNTNRVINQIRTVGSKKGGSQAPQGSVSFNFKHVGRVRLAGDCDEEALMDLVLEAGADEVERHDDEEEGDYFEVQTDFKAYAKVLKNLKDGGYADKINHENCVLGFETDLPVSCSDEDYEKNIQLLEGLQGMDDVLEVYHSMDES